MAKAGRVAVARFIMRGKESIVLVRPAQDGLMLHTMYFADEVRDFGEIDKGKSAKIAEREGELARKLIDELSTDAFNPEQYKDEYRERVLEMVNQKVEGKEITTAATEAPRSQVIDLMDALRESLAKRAAGVPRKPPTKISDKTARPAAPVRKAQGGKK
jgi:DNA end-binding protein Ku